MGLIMDYILCKLTPDIPDVDPYYDKEDKYIEELKPVYDGRIYYRVLVDIDGAKDVIKHYENGSVCLINLDMKLDKYVELFSFISGAIYALDGEIEEISPRMYLVT